MLIHIDGSLIFNEEDFHRQFAKILDIEAYYGANLNALWDTVSRNIERPSSLIWYDSQQSKQRLGKDFDRIVEILEYAVQEDIAYPLAEQFRYELR